ncbi:MAG: OadG family transporter subunit [Bacteroidales bacterium]
MWIPCILLRSNISLETLVIAVAGYLIVFLALVLLFALFRLIPGLISLRIRKKQVRSGKSPSGEAELSGEEAAAIAMAIHLYMSELHDEESGILTIKKVSKTYSPWSSKIYAVRNQFNRL